MSGVPTLEERIQKTFDITFEEFLLDDIGFVKFHRFNTTSPKENWGIIEATNGDVLFFTKNVREWVFYGSSKPGRSFLQLTGPLQQGQPVTFTTLKQDDGRLRAPEVALWQPERFEGIQLAILSRPLYRLVSTRPDSGGLGGASTGSHDEVLWRGKNIQTLRRMFPKDKYQIRGTAVSGRRFELLNRDTGAWELCDDPR